MNVTADIIEKHSYDRDYGYEPDREGDYPIEEVSFEIDEFGEPNFSDDPEAFPIGCDLRFHFIINGRNGAIKITAIRMGNEYANRWFNLPFNSLMASAASALLKKRNEEFEDWARCKLNSEIRIG